MAKKDHYMNGKEFYKNGQIIFEQKGKTLTYYFKSGQVKAKGKSIDKLMEGKWNFYRESGELHQIGNFKSNKKHGKWIRYNIKGDEEYHAQFSDGKLVEKII